MLHVQQKSPPVELSAHVDVCPAATMDQEGPLWANTGMRREVVDPSPSW